MINSHCAAYRLPRNGLLLDYEDELSTVFEEAYDLGEDIYGGFDKPRSNLFTQLKDLILATSMNQNSMQRDIEMRRKTEAEYFTGLATGRDGFLNLKKLHGYLIWRIKSF